MKLIKTKLLKKATNRRLGKYQITLEVTDKDIEMFENLNHTYAPFVEIEKATKKNDWESKYSPEFTEKYSKWINKTWRCFWKLWDCYD